MKNLKQSGMDESKAQSNCQVANTLDPKSDRRQEKKDKYNDPKYLLATKSTVAEMTQLSVRAIERLESSGQLPSVRIRGSVRYRLADIWELIDKCSSECQTTR